MADQKTLVSARPTCPLCNSNARKQIDALIHARHFAPVDAATTQVITETGEIVEIEGRNDTYEQTFEEIKELLTKIPGQNTQAFTLLDVIIHGTNGHVVSDIIESGVRSEGKYLFAGGTVREFPDLKDYLRLIISVSAQQLLNGDVKVPPKIGVDASLALWRMSGDAGGNDMVEAMIDLVTKGGIKNDTPLGKAYAERQATLARKKEAEQAPDDPPPPDVNHADN